MNYTFSRNMSICIMCRNYCGKCAWSKYFMPVEGWTAIEAYKTNGELNRAWVSWCPLFKADAGLYDLMVHGDPKKGRIYIIKQYGYITELRYTVIRYHLVNDYERTEDDNKTTLQDCGIPLRQVNEAEQRKMLDTLSQKMAVQR